MLLADTTLITTLQKLYVHDNKVKINVSSVQNFSELPQISPYETKYLGKSNLTWIWSLKVALVPSEYRIKNSKVKIHRVRTQFWWDENKYLSICNVLSVKRLRSEQGPCAMTPGASFSCRSVPSAGNYHKMLWKSGLKSPRCKALPTFLKSLRDFPQTRLLSGQDFLLVWTGLKNLPLLMPILSHWRSWDLLGHSTRRGFTPQHWSFSEHSQTPETLMGSCFPNTSENEASF